MVHILFAGVSNRINFMTLPKKCDYNIPKGFHKVQHELFAGENMNFFLAFIYYIKKYARRKRLSV